MLIETNASQRRGGKLAELPVLFIEPLLNTQDDRRGKAFETSFTANTTMPELQAIKSAASPGDRRTVESAMTNLIF
jgi:hypothetical protein